MSFLITRKVVNGVVDMLKADLGSLLEIADLKLEKVMRGKHKVLSYKNCVFVSNAKYIPDALTRKYLVEIYFNVSHSNPETLEDMVGDFSDCIVEAFRNNPLLNDEVSDSNTGDGYFYVSEQSIHTAIGKLEVEITI